MVYPPLLSVAAVAQDGVVVFDNQDGFTSARPVGRDRRCGRPVHLFERPRQQDLERGADADLAIDRQAATSLGDNSVAGRQAKAGSPAPLLGREERIEYPADMFRLNSNSGIADAHRHIVAWRHFLIRDDAV